MIDVFDRDDFRERARAAIKAAGGNKVVSRRSGIALSTMGNIVSGKSVPSIENTMTLAAVCDVSLDWLAYGIDRDNPLPARINDFEAFTQLHSAIWSNLQPLVDQGHIRIAAGVSPVKLTASIARTLDSMKKSDITNPVDKRGLSVDNQDDPTASQALVAIMEDGGITDQELADKMSVETTLIETLKTDELEWDTELAMKVAEALEVSPLKFLMPGQQDPVGDEFFRLWSTLSDEDRSKVSDVLQSLVEGSDDDQH